MLHHMRARKKPLDIPHSDARASSRAAARPPMPIAASPLASAAPIPGKLVFVGGAARHFAGQLTTVCQRRCVWNRRATARPDDASQGAATRLPPHAAHRVSRVLATVRCLHAASVAGSSLPVAAGAGARAGGTQRRRAGRRRVLRRGARSPPIERHVRPRQTGAAPRSRCAGGGRGCACAGGQGRQEEGRGACAQGRGGATCGAAGGGAPRA